MLEASVLYLVRPSARSACGGVCAQTPLLLVKRVSRKQQQQSATGHGLTSFSCLLKVYFFRSERGGKDDKCWIHYFDNSEIPMYAL